MKTVKPKLAHFRIYSSFQSKSNADANRAIVWRLLNILKAHLCMYIGEHTFIIAYSGAYFSAFDPNLCLCLYFPRLFTTASRTRPISVLPFLPNPAPLLVFRSGHSTCSMYLLMTFLKREMLYKLKLNKSLHASTFPSIIVKDSPFFPLTC